MSDAASGGELSAESQGRIDRLCHQFEAAWKANELPPRLDDFLKSDLSDERTALLVELIALDLHYRRNRGEPARPEDYLSRFPELKPGRLADLFSEYGDVTVEAAPDPHETRSTQIPVEPPPPGSRGEVLPSIPGYDVTGVLGRGGMGVVFEARQSGLKRRVALKMIRDARYAGPFQRSRFQAEAEAIAALHHPHIVQIYEIAEFDGLPYFSLEFVDGGNLGQRIARSAQAPRWSAEMAEQLARAVAAAHAKGIIHRDLKPANVLLTKDGQPKITDFGLAKSLESDTDQTRTGEVLGTPSYMAPEQAQGLVRDVGPLADVWALGVILYEMLTGRLPFVGETPVDVLLLITNAEPVPPRRLEPLVPRDLETICLKALAKTPGRRYASAGEMADDLRRFLDGRPILARPAGRVERFGRWCRRNPVVAGLTAAVALLLIVGSTVAGVLTVGMIEETRRANNNAGEARQAAEDAAAEKVKAQGEERNTRRYFYAAQMAGILDAWDRGDVIAVQQMLETLRPRPGQEDLRGPDWHYLWRLVHGSRLTLGDAAAPYSSVAFADGGRTLVAGGPGRLALHDSTTGKEMARLTPDPAATYSLLAVADDRVAVLGKTPKLVTLWLLAEGKLQSLLEVNDSFPERWFQWSVSRDVKSLALAVGAQGTPKNLRVWDLSSKKERFSRRSEWCTALTFAPDGATLAVGGGESRMANSVLLIDTQTGKTRATLKGPNDAVSGLAFSPEGTHIASANVDSTARLWDVQDDKPPATVHLTNAGESVAFSADGRSFAVGFYRAGPISIFDAVTMKRVASLWGHNDGVRQLAFSTDNKTLASASTDGTVRLWDLSVGARQGKKAELPGPNPRVLALAVAADGRTMASAGADHTVRLWETATGKERARLVGHTDEVTTVAYAPDGLSLASGSGDGTVRIWDLSGQPRALFRDAAGILAVAFAPDGRSLLTATAGSGLKLRDPVTGRILARLLQEEPQARAVAFSPDGQWIVAGCRDGTVRVWDAASQQLRHSIRAHQFGVRSVAFWPDSRILSTGGEDKRLAHWDVTTGKASPTPSNPQSLDDPVVVAVAPDGKALLTGTARATSDRGAARAWSVVSPTVVHGPHLALLDCAEVTCAVSLPGGRFAWGNERGLITLSSLDHFDNGHAYLAGHAARPSAIAVSHDGRWLAEASADFTIRVRDLASGQQRIALVGHQGSVSALEFSRDGSTLASAASDRRVRLWDLSSGEVRQTLITGNMPLLCLALSPDGRRVAAGDGQIDRHGVVRVWDATSGRLTATLKPESWSVRTLAFSPDNQTIAVGTAADWANLHGTLTLWATESGQRLAQLGSSPAMYSHAGYHAAGHAVSVSAVAFSRDGQTLVSGGGDGTVRLWDVTARRQTKVFQEPEEGIRALCFAADGRTVGSLGWSGVLRYWDVSRGEARGCVRLGPLTAFTLRSLPSYLAFTPEGKIVTQQPDGTAGIFEGAPPVDERAYDAELESRSSVALDSMLELQVARLGVRLAITENAEGGAEASETLKAARERLNRLRDRVTLSQEDEQVLTDADTRIFSNGKVERNSARGFYNRAEVLVRTARGDESLVMGEEGRLRFPFWSVPLTLRAHAVKQLGHTRQSAGLFRESMRFSEFDSRSRFELAEVLLASGQSDEALALSREAVRLSPTMGEAHHQLANALAKGGQFGKALASYREARRLSPFSGEIRTNLGLCLAELGKDEEAMTELREGVRKGPRSAWPGTALAAELRRRGNSEESLTVLQEVLKTHPTYYKAHIELFRVLDSEKLWEPAMAARKASVAALEKAIRVPDGEEHRSDLAEAYAGLAAIQLNCPDKNLCDPRAALINARKAAAMHGGVMEGWAALALACHRNDEVDEGRRAIDQLLARTDPMAQLCFFLGEMALDRGHREQARRCYDRGTAWMDNQGSEQKSLLEKQSHLAERLGVAH